MGGELTALARPQLLETENRFHRRRDKKRRGYKRIKKEKSIVVRNSLIALSLLL